MQWIETNKRTPEKEYQKFKEKHPTLNYYPLLATMYDARGKICVDKIFFNGQNFTNGGRVAQKENILAWMPLPKPYRKDDKA